MKIFDRVCCHKYLCEEKNLRIGFPVSSAANNSHHFVVAFSSNTSKTMLCAQLVRVALVSGFRDVQGEAVPFLLNKLMSRFCCALWLQILTTIPQVI